LAGDELALGDLTALLGRNGAGKSAFLHALDLFYSLSRRVTVEDFYDQDTTQSIEIAVQFSGLSTRAQELFEKYVEGDSLRVEKVYRWNDGNPKATYHGATLQHRPFAPLREALGLTDRGMTAKLELERLRGRSTYSDLPAWTTKDGVTDSLREWEANHRSACERARDEGQFFGFSQVAQGFLGRFTRLLFIPAVRDATGDATEGRSSVFTELLDLVVRSEMAKKEAVRQVEEEFRRRVDEVMKPDRNPELGTLATDLTGALQRFVPTAEVRLDWLPLEPVEVPLPRADLKLVEDGYPAPVNRCGHGLQRAFVLTMLQRLAQAQHEHEEAEAGGPDLPSLVLVVEEPELYQHPNRQRHFAKVLARLPGGQTPGVAHQTQVLYATHSPLFVSIDRFEDVRLLRKVHNRERPKVTVNTRANLDTVALKVWTAAGEPEPQFTADTLRPRLTAVMTPWMNEGFFAELAVLVEGEDDRAAVLGMADSMGVDLEATGVSVIPCHGKTNLDKPTAIFSSLGIPVFVVWDSDEGRAGARPEENHLLLRLLGREVEDWPGGLGPTHACFSSKLEDELEAALGEHFKGILSAAQAEYGIPKKKQALKRPEVIRYLVDHGVERGLQCELLRRTVERIQELVVGLQLASDYDSLAEDEGGAVVAS